MRLYKLVQTIDKKAISSVGVFNEQWLDVLDIVSHFAECL